jgi:pimeloyl-ACP methyl ester carboxylesterase
MKNISFLRAFRIFVSTLLLLFFTVRLTAQVQTARYITTNPRSNAFYEYLPQGYNSGNETYPLIVFIHGLGELGAGNASTLPLVLRNGTPKQISQGIFPASFTVNGVTSKFIVISPQFTEWPGPSDINTLLNYLIQNYRVDQSRIYLTGLSMGGGVVWEYAGSSPVYANRLAGIVPICGASWPDQGRSETIAAANLPVWATHNDGDPTAPLFYTVDYVNYINNAPAPPTPLAKKTIFVSNSHDAWTKTYDLNFRENGLNVYEWFLTQKRIIGNNPPPIVNAGPDKIITLPTNSVRYEASATDPGGSLSIVRWTKVSGPAAGTIDNPTGLWTNMVNLVQGVYVFRLSVTDNGGALTTDDVTVTVNGSGAANQPPTASAGTDKTITLPTSATTLTGGATDADGTISTYAWTKFNGPAAGAIATPTAATTNLTGLVQGAYVFRLTVTDNNGATSSDDVTVTVNAAAAVNQLPVASAGADQSITLPINTLNVTGGATDADGTISSYAWTKFNGPAGGTIATPAAANTTLSGLVQGTYIFRLTVTDNNGGSASDDVTVTVQPATAPPPATTSKSIKVNIFGGSNPYTNPQWNNWNSNSNLTSGNFFYEDQTASTVNASITGQAGVADNGAGYASGATVVPSEILRYNSYNTSNRTLTIRGLSPSVKYSIQFFGSRANTGNKTVVQVGSAADTINTDNNANDYANLTNLSPDNSGTISVDLYRIGTYNYLAGFIISSGTTTGPAPNQPPVANAGTDINITLPANTATLTGTGTDTDGSITTYAWAKTAGPAAGAITTSNAATTTLTGLVQGSYTFRLTVTDNNGAVQTDDVAITVNAAAANQLPVANAGMDKIITLPINSTTLAGSGTDSDGSISAYAWTKFNGPATGTITTPAAATTTLAGLVEGTYTFRLTVTDNSGGSTSDDVVITVAAATPPPATSGRTIRVNIYGGTNPFANTQWNNWNSTGSLNSNTFLYEDQTSSSVSASITDQAGVADNGANYASGATAAPSQVLRYNSYNTSNRTLSLKGLNPSSRYSMQFFGSRANTGNKTIVQVGNATDTINTDNNANDYANLTGLVADNSGRISVELSRIGTYNYLAGFIITEENVATRGVMATIPAITSAVVPGLSTDPVLKYLYDVNVYPNPVQSNLTATITIPEVNKQVILLLTDEQGKVMYQKQVMVAQKTENIQIDMSSFRDGVYILTMKAGAKNISRQVVKMSGR